MPIRGRLLAVLLASLCMLFAHAAVAVPVLWTLTDVEFDDGGTAAGAFVYDAASGTFSDIAITTSGGRLMPAAYADVLEGGANDALLVADALADLTSATGFQLVFQAPLTDTGGFVDLASFDPFFSSFELACLDAGCASATIERTVITGGLSGTVVPLPGGLVLLASALGLLARARSRV